MLHIAKDDDAARPASGCDLREFVPHRSARSECGALFAQFLLESDMEVGDTSASSAMRTGSSGIGSRSTSSKEGPLNNLAAERFVESQGIREDVPEWFATSRRLGVTFLLEREVPAARRERREARRVVWCIPSDESAVKPQRTSPVPPPSSRIPGIVELEPCPVRTMSTCPSRGSWLQAPSRLPDISARSSGASGNDLPERVGTRGMWSENRLLPRGTSDPPHRFDRIRIEDHRHWMPRTTSRMASSVPTASPSRSNGDGVHAG